jgi:thiol-disulfide isomerase/thioredoxin
MKSRSRSRRKTKSRSKRQPRSRTKAKKSNKISTRLDSKSRKAKKSSFMVCRNGQCRIIFKRVYYFGAKWCGPCQFVKPTFHKLSEKYKKSIRSIHVDIDQEESLANEYNITSVPSFVFVDGDTEKHRLLGANAKELERLYRQFAK